jgi:hypothetical protein
MNFAGRFFGTAWTKRQMEDMAGENLSLKEKAQEWLRGHLRNPWHCRFGHTCDCGIAHPEGTNTCCCECITAVRRLMG